MGRRLERSQWRASLKGRWLKQVALVCAWNQHTDTLRHRTECINDAIRSQVIFIEVYDPTVGLKRKYHRRAHDNVGGPIDLRGSLADLPTQRERCQLAQTEQWRSCGDEADVELAIVRVGFRGHTGETGIASRVADHDLRDFTLPVRS